LVAPLALRFTVCGRSRRLRIGGIFALFEKTRHTIDQDNQRSGWGVQVSV
jgi:hypothetical protein